MSKEQLDISKVIKDHMAALYSAFAELDALMNEVKHVMDDFQERVSSGKALTARYIGSLAVLTLTGLNNANTKFHKICNKVIETNKVFKEANGYFEISPYGLKEMTSHSAAVSESASKLQRLLDKSLAYLNGMKDAAERIEHSANLPSDTKEQPND